MADRARSQSMLQFRRCQPRDCESPVRRQPVINRKGSGQASPRNDPPQQPITFQMRGLCDHSHLTGQAARQRRHPIRIAEAIGKIEIPFANQALWIDCQPAARTKVEDVAMVHVSMQRYDVLLSSEEVRRYRGRDTEYSAPRLSRHSEWFKPLREGNESGRS